MLGLHRALLGHIRGCLTQLLRVYGIEDELIIQAEVEAKIFQTKITVWVTTKGEWGYGQWLHISPWLSWLSLVQCLVIVLVLQSRVLCQCCQTLHIIDVSRIHAERRDDVVLSESAMQIFGEGCYQVGFGQTVGQGQRTTDILIHVFFITSLKWKITRYLRKLFYLLAEYLL